MLIQQTAEQDEKKSLCHQLKRY